MAQSKTKKHQVAIWVTNKTDVKSVKPVDWIRVGKSTANTVNANPETQTYDYIDSELPTTELDKYVYSMDHDIACIKGNPDYEFAFDKYFYHDTGDNAKGLVLVVFADHEGPAGVFKAFIHNATFSISSYDAVGGVVNMSIAFDGNPIFGAVTGWGNPVFTEAPANVTIVNTDGSVSLACETADAVIKYTTDGTNPQTSATAETYSDTIELESGTIKAVASVTKGSDTIYGRVTSLDL